MIAQIYTVTNTSSKLFLHFVYETYRTPYEVKPDLKTLNWNPRFLPQVSTMFDKRWIFWEQLIDHRTSSSIWVLSFVELHSTDIEAQT